MFDCYQLSQARTVTVGRRTGKHTVLTLRKSTF